MEKSNEINARKKNSNQVFWGEMSPCEHLVQIYENDESFIDLLEGFVTSGLYDGECVIVIATKPHLQLLEDRMRKEGFNLFQLKLNDQFIAVNAEDALSTFMIHDWPDEVLFRHLVTNLITRAKRNDKKVRAFGEMVALLWAKGQTGATVHLEHLWNNFMKNENFTLFCAYPKSGFTMNAAESILEICSCHSKVINGGKEPELLFN
jgi:hypothetical protein